ncbi:MAG TPA: DUF58 domain-containing protein [Planctomicrobium sp.]|nr:DUF58 domain-containing protein [Planctomicrobium sp.]
MTNWLIKLNHRMQTALHYDFCPSANRWVYWIKHPLACVTLVGIVGAVCSLLVNPHAWSIVAVIAAIGLLGTIWPWIAIRGIQCDLTFERRRGREGQPANVRLKIRNRCPWPVWGLSLQKGFAVSGESREGIALSSISGSSTVEFLWPFVPPRRGVYPLENPIIETGFPFGICHGQKPARCSGELLVWPASVSLRGMPDAVEIQPRQTRLADRRVGDMGDIIGTREFRMGDPLRRVHWGQTARHRRLIVTERQAPASCAMQLVVDIDAASHDGTDSNGTLEQTLRLVASLCESLHAQHSDLDCLIGSERISIGSSQGELQRLLDQLARIPAGGLRTSGTTCRFHGARRKSRFVITTPQSFLKHLGHHHSATSGDRFILITPCHAAEVSGTTGSCGCHSWLEIQASESLESVLPQRWRRACHV